MPVHPDPEKPRPNALESGVLWPISLWGGAATVALAAAILMTQTEDGTRQLDLLFGTAAAPIEQATQAELSPPPVAKTEAKTEAKIEAKVDTKPDTKSDAETETLRQQTAQLEARIRDLAADRERLSARIVTLEQTLSDVTGSIKRERDYAAAAKPPAAPPPVAVSDTAPKPELKAEPKPETKMAVAAPQPVPTLEAPQAAPPSNPPASPPTPQVAALVADPEPPPPTGHEIAIDLGGARSMEIMQARWLAVKANFGPLLQGMRPLVIQEKRPGYIPLRLIVGPIPNGAAAAQICKRLAASKVACRTTRFAGEPLTFQ